MPKSISVCVYIRLGLCAEEIHVCGESAAVDFVRELMFTTGEEVEVRLERVVRQAPKCFAAAVITPLLIIFFIFFVFVSS